MIKISLYLTPLVLAGMIYDKIDHALHPYEAAFFTYGGYAALAFIAFLFGLALDERLHRLETQGKDPAR